MITQEEILTILNLFDPEKLLAMGAPMDEYEAEAFMIAEKIENYRIYPPSQPALQRMVVDVFDEMFYGLPEHDPDFMRFISDTIWNVLFYRHARDISDVEFMKKKAKEMEEGNEE